MTLPCCRCGGEQAGTWLAPAERSGYRDSYLTALRCDSCRLLQLDRETAQSLLGDEELGGDVTERDRRSSGLWCRGCLATLERVTLSWGASWVEIEQCPRCGLLLCDEGELSAVTGLTRMQEPG